MIRNHTALLHHLRTIHQHIRDAVVQACEHTAQEHLATIVADAAGDTVFALDRIAEAVLLPQLQTLAHEWSCIVIAEGLPNGGTVVLPPGSDPRQAELRIIVDPIDGTRGLMYQKRSAWILTGVARNHGERTNLRDIELAIQTEIPTVKQHLSDILWAVAGAGAHAERWNRLTGEQRPFRLQPSRAPTIAQGYGGLARSFPGARDELATIDDLVIERVLGPAPAGKVHAFEDQYASTGGQLYELVMGHDRWVADLRPLVQPILRTRGHAANLCCHPYDLCTELIGREAGLLVTDAYGNQLATPLDVERDVAWVGYANRAIYTQVEPVLQQVLQERGFI